MPRPCINYALAGTLIAAGVTYAEAAKQTGAANGESLRRVLARKGVTARQARAIPVTNAPPMSVTLSLATAAGELLRNSLAKDLQATADKVGNLPTVGYKALKQRVEVLEPLARTAKIVYRWSDDAKPTINLNLVTDTRLADLPVIDCESNTLPVG